MAVAAPPAPPAVIDLDSIQARVNAAVDGLIISEYVPKDRELMAAHINAGGRMPGKEYPRIFSIHELKCAGADAMLYPDSRRAVVNDRSGYPRAWREKADTVARALHGMGYTVTTKSTWTHDPKVRRLKGGNPPHNDVFDVSEFRMAA